MLNISDTATDDEFDAAIFYPEKRPKTDGKLEQKRHKISAKKGVKYLGRSSGVKDYTDLEKEQLVSCVENIAAEPTKLGYNPIHGWTATINEICADALYEFRKKTPSIYMNIPYRNETSIASKFKSWEDGKSKEGKDKDYISRFIAAKNSIQRDAKKAASNVNEELESFTMDYYKGKLGKAEKKIKALKTENKDSLAPEFRGLIKDVKGLIDSVQNEHKDEKLDITPTQNVSETTVQSKLNLDKTSSTSLQPPHSHINIIPDSSSYNQSYLSQNQANISVSSPSYNQRTSSQNRVNMQNNDISTMAHVSTSIYTNNNKPISDISNQGHGGNVSSYIDNEKERYQTPSSSLTNCIEFLTRIQNKSYAFDEEAIQNKSTATRIEVSLFDPSKQSLILAKCTALCNVGSLTDEQMLNQMKHMLDNWK